MNALLAFIFRWDIFDNSSITVQNQLLLQKSSRKERENFWFCFLKMGEEEKVSFSILASMLFQVYFYVSNLCFLESHLSCFGKNDLYLGGREYSVWKSYFFHSVQKFSKMFHLKTKHSSLRSLAFLLRIVSFFFVLFWFFCKLMILRIKCVILGLFIGLQRASQNRGEVCGEKLVLQF